LAGRVLGDFTLGERLGAGGGGVIYGAEQRLLGREAVVKLLHVRDLEAPERVDRFLREAQLASRLDHPYAAHIYAFGAEPDGLLWIAMERVRGTSLAQPGAHLGSPFYMAPEQWIEDGVVDARSDVYALGVLTFESLTGRVPFAGGTVGEIARQHLTAEVPALPADLPAALAPVLRGALAKSRDDRPASALAFAEAVRVAAGVSVSADILPRLEAAVRQDVAWLPQPIADAIAGFETARNPHQARDALWEIVHVRNHGIAAPPNKCRGDRSRSRPEPCATRGAPRGELAAARDRDPVSAGIDRDAIRVARRDRAGVEAVPQHDAIPARARHEGAVATDLAVIRSAGATGERGDGAAGRGLPDRRLAVVADRDDVRTVGAERGDAHVPGVLVNRELGARQALGAREQDPHGGRRVALGIRLGEVGQGAQVLAVEQEPAALLLVGLDQPTVRGQGVLARRPVQHGERGGAGDEQAHRRRGDGAADPSPAGLVGEARGREREVHRRDATGPALAPAPVVVERLAAPQEAAWPAALVPLLRGGAQLVAQPSALDVLAPPLDQPRPRGQEGLVHDLDALLAGVALGGDQEPRGDQALDHGRAVVAAEHADQRIAPEHRPRALGGHQVAKHLAHEALLIGRAGEQRGLGMAGERALGVDQVVRIADGRGVVRLPASGPVDLLAVGAEGTIATTSGSVIELWDVAGTRRARIDGGATVTTAAISPDGRWVAVASDDQILRLYEGTSGAPRGELVGHRGAVGSVEFSADGTRLASAGSDLTVRIWDVETHRQLTSLLGARDQYVRNGSRFDPAGARLVVPTWDGAIRVYATTAPDLVTSVDAEGALALGEFFAGGRRFATSSDHGLATWETITGRKLAAIAAPPSSFSRISPDGKLVANLPSDTAVAQIRDLATGTLAAELRGSGQFRWASFDHASRQIVTAGDDHLVELWTVRGDRLATLRGHTASVVSVAFSRDDRLIASGSTDRTARVWEVATGRVICKVTGGDVMASVDFDATGTRLLTGNADRLVRLWNIATGDPLRTFEHTTTLRYVTGSPDGTLVAGATTDGSVSIWDSATSSLLVQLHHQASAESVDFWPGGPILLSTSADHQAVLWHLEAETRSHETVTAFARCHAPYALRETRLEPVTPSCHDE